MSAVEYNKVQQEDGDFTGEMVQKLVEHWQESFDLDPDGYCGPNTQASLEKALRGDSPVSSEFALAALDIACKQIGKGEEGGNNSGPFVEMLFGKTFDGDDDDDGSWCAAFVSWCFEQAAEQLSITMPFKRSGGAKSLWKNIGNAGSFPKNPEPGDVVCWDRGKPGSWQGHIGFVERLEGGILHTIEGNVGSYPSKVRRFMHDLSRETRIEGFGRVPKQ